MVKVFKNVQELLEWIDENYSYKDLMTKYFLRGIPDDIENFDLQKFMNTQSKELEAEATEILKEKGMEAVEEYMREQGYDKWVIEDGEVWFYHPGVYADPAGDPHISMQYPTVVFFKGKPLYYYLDGYIVEPEEVIAIAPTNRTLTDEEVIRLEEKFGAPPDDPPKEKKKRPVHIEITSAARMVEDAEKREEEVREEEIECDIPHFIEYIPTSGGIRIRKINLGNAGKSKRRPFARILEEFKPEKRGGYAFEGRPLPTWREVDVENGTYIIVVRGDGSWKHPHSTIYLIKVMNNRPCILAQASWPDYELTFKDEVAKYFKVPREEEEEKEEEMQEMWVAVVGTKFDSRGDRFVAEGIDFKKYNIDFKRVVAVKYDPVADVAYLLYMTEHADYYSKTSAEPTPWSLDAELEVYTYNIYLCPRCGAKLTVEAGEAVCPECGWEGTTSMAKVGRKKVYSAEVVVKEPYDKVIKILNDLGIPAAEVPRPVLSGVQIKPINVEFSKEIHGFRFECGTFELWDSEMGMSRKTVGLYVGGKIKDRHFEAFAEKGCRVKREEVEKEKEEEKREEEKEEKIEPGKFIYEKSVEGEHLHTPPTVEKELEQKLTLHDYLFRLSQYVLAKYDRTAVFLLDNIIKDIAKTAYEEGWTIDDAIKHLETRIENLKKFLREFNEMWLKREVGLTQEYMNAFWEAVLKSKGDLKVFREILTSPRSMAKLEVIERTEEREEEEEAAPEEEEKVSPRQEERWYRSRARQRAPSRPRRKEVVFECSGTRIPLGWIIEHWHDIISFGLKETIYRHTGGYLSNRCLEEFARWWAQLVRQPIVHVPFEELTFEQAVLRYWADARRIWERVFTFGLYSTEFKNYLMAIYDRLYRLAKVGVSRADVLIRLRQYIENFDPFNP